MTCAKALTDLMNSVVSKHPKFQGATIHVEDSTGMVINIMRWDKATDFIEFRDSNQEIIGSAIGRFGPKGRMLKISAEISTDRAPHNFQT